MKCYLILLSLVLAATAGSIYQLAPPQFDYADKPNYVVFSLSLDNDIPVGGSLRIIVPDNVSLSSCRFATREDPETSVSGSTGSGGNGISYFSQFAKPMLADTYYTLKCYCSQPKVGVTGPISISSYAGVYGTQLGGMQVDSNNVFGYFGISPAATTLSIAMTDSGIVDKPFFLRSVNIAASSSSWAIPMPDEWRFEITIQNDFTFGSGSVSNIRFGVLGVTL